MDGGWIREMRPADVAFGVDFAGGGAESEGRTWQGSYNPLTLILILSAHLTLLDFSCV